MRRSGDHGIGGDPLTRVMPPFQEGHVAPARGPRAARLGVEGTVVAVTGPDAAMVDLGMGCDPMPVRSRRGAPLAVGDRVWVDDSRTADPVVRASAVYPRVARHGIRRTLRRMLWP